MKEVKLNLLEEYKSHLKMMGKLKHFAGLKLYWDHAFFKIFIPNKYKKSIPELSKQDAH
jgi:hypothetical protein